MPINFSEPPIESQLRLAIREMANFLIDSPTNEEYYKMQYEKIDKLAIKSEIEGWFGYKHKNPYKDLNDFLAQNNTKNLTKKYYSIPILSKKIIDQSKGEKIIRGAEKKIEWVFNQIAKINLFRR